MAIRAMGVLWRSGSEASEQASMIFLSVRWEIRKQEAGGDCTIGCALGFLDGLYCLTSERGTTCARNSNSSCDQMDITYQIQSPCVATFEEDLTNTRPHRMLLWYLIYSDRDFYSVLVETPTCSVESQLRKADSKVLLVFHEKLTGAMMHRSVQRLDTAPPPHT